MRFALSTEQRVFARSLDGLLSTAGGPAAARAWGDGDPTAGLTLWRRLAGLGLHALCVPEKSEEPGATSADPVDMVVAFEELGRHLAPGPYIESVVVAPALLAALGPPAVASLDAIAAGTEIATLAAPPDTPFALDADLAEHVWLLDGGRLHRATAGPPRRSVDITRRPAPVSPGGVLGTLPPGTVAAALDAAALACSAQLLGAGERLLAAAVAHAAVRRQFGRPIGEFQALKHALADIRVALDFARPLVHGAALSLRAGSPDAARDVSAAKVAAAEAAYRAARTALQVHGAIGYTLEYDLGLWVMKVRALVGAWGTTAVHRGRVLAALTP